MPFIWKLWVQGCHTIAQIYRELRAQGYRESYASVHDNIVPCYVIQCPVKN